MSRLPFELLLALRYLRPKRTFVSVITLISVLGVTLGVAVLIIVISVMTGFDHDLRDKILGFDAHLTITARDHTMTNYQAVMKEVRSNPHVKGMAPFIRGQVLLESHPLEGEQPLDAAPFVLGVDEQVEGQVSDLLTNIIEGSANLSGRGIVVGKVFARGLHLMVGDRVTIYSPSDLRKIKQAMENDKKMTLPDDYEVRGIFDADYFEYNAFFIFTSLENAQSLNDLGDDVHALKVKLDDPERAGAVRRELAETLGPGYQISLWSEGESSSLLDAIAVEKNVMFYILFFIMIVAALCILSALITFVVQKTREIGMLKAIGATNWQISGIFLAQSAMVGVMGVVAGYGLGILAVTYRNEFLHFLRRITGWELFPASIYGFGDLPALIVPNDVILICTSALVICLFGGVIPAWQAGRLKPVEALRHE